VPTGHLLAFAVTALVIIVIPGPSVMFIVGRALAHGRRAAVMTVIGNTAGEYVQTIVVAVGIGLLVERSIVVFDVLKLGGAAYLIVLGVRAFRHRRSLEAAVSAVAAVSGGPVSGTKLALQGAFVGATNPKTIVFLSAILPQFVDRASGHVPLQILLLGLVFAGIALASDAIWAMLAGTFRSWFARSPRRLQLVGGAGGLAIIAVGAGLALSGRKD
jgi:threonine/homoserine/homoserine lactone efflux protein